MNDFLLLCAMVACITWTITKEEIFLEVREFFIRLKKDPTQSKLVRKLAYMPTCEYCTSHWVTLAVFAATGAPAGEFLWSFFPVVFGANVLMTIYAMLRAKLKELLVMRGL